MQNANSMINQDQMTRRDIICWYFANEQNGMRQTLVSSTAAACIRESQLISFYI